MAAPFATSWPQAVSVIIFLTVRDRSSNVSTLFLLHSTEDRIMSQCALHALVANMACNTAGLVAVDSIGTRQ
uniref:Uncharacterized protein n=1 Tax=Hyaloperonospora arabidopsidis (strain Emoy2) TaxID=559515 RepID=M4B161_HYAAE